MKNWDGKRGDEMRQKRKRGITSGESRNCGDGRRKYKDSPLGETGEEVEEDTRE